MLRYTYIDSPPPLPFFLKKGSLNIQNVVFIHSFALNLSLVLSFCTPSGDIMRIARSIIRAAANTGQTIASRQDSFITKRG
jgi:hypothetical protein